MKIVERIDRECCDQQYDLLLYRGNTTGIHNRAHQDIRFCKHCGQVWLSVSREDAHGGPYWKKLSVTQAEE